MIAIYLREINSFLSSLIAYLVIGVFLLITGLFLWVFPQSSILNTGFSNMDSLFLIAPYVFLFLIPAITMRAFAEEKKSGTIEFLLTKPVSDYQIIIAKYLANLTLVLFSIAPTLIYYYSVYQLGNPVGNIDSAGIAGSYIGLIFLCAVFTSIGLFASSLTQNQITAFVLAVFLSFIIFEGFQSLSEINVWGKASVIISKLGIAHHYNSISKGLIDSRDLLYFISVIILMLSGTKLILDSRKW
ncbi:gliding motility-associated ABC transporter permease subunit GldF [Hyphobacterium sp. CCMP332]|nr:gliding motility-associated ABC transporter permease subunit GldF [Hyphobacterium sp. CCMP332]